MKQFVVVFLILASLTSFAQKGTIRGKVFDDETGESLVGVTVLIKELGTGAITDLDGKFSYKLEAGIYNLRLSYISYQTMTVEDVEIKAGEVTVLNNLRLKTSQEELKAVVVTADIVRSSETALTTIKRKSNTIMDGVSSEKMKLIGDATAAEAVKRVTGVSVEDGKYFYVRGLGDRYSKSMLNNVEVPGLDPDRNTLQMDIFPSALIANMTVKKNFSADLPADFTGGLLNIETKDFPDREIFNVSAGISYNPDMHLNSGYLAYDGGSTDFLGFDDGTRALPDMADQESIPTPINPNYSDAEVTDFVKSFSSTLAAKRQNSFMNSSFGLTYGNQIDFNQNDKDSPNKLGYIFSMSYKADYKYYNDVIYSEYQRYTNPDKYEMRYSTIQDGEMGEYNVLSGLLGGVAYKTALSKYRLTAMHLQSGSSRAAKFSIDNDGSAVGQSGYTATSDNLEYNQRSLTNVLLSGQHVLDDSGWKIDWRVSPTFSISEDPDIRKTAFTYENNEYYFNAGAGGNPSRIWRSLNELNATAKIDARKKYKFNDEDAELKIGASHTYKQRDYEILEFTVQFFGGSQSWDKNDASQVLNDQYIYPSTTENNIYYQSGNSVPNPNQYASNVNNTALYVSNEMELLHNLKSILGLRLENYVQRHTGRDQQWASGDTQNGENLDNEKVLESLDLFPSVNFIYALTSKQNLRLGYSRTIARPSFKELSFAQIIDPISNRIFNGALFSYNDSWDGNLVETRINNFDLRWEMYLKRGQLFSVSGFYKQFNDPIELVRIPEQQTSTEYQPRNVGDGTLYGVELEFRKNLDFISPALSNLNLNGNLTVVESKINMTDVEYKSRKAFERTGEEIDRERQMAGQSPYVINGGVTYSNNEKGFETGVFYNVKGPTLTIVGAGLFPDIYIEPYHSLNFSVNKALGKDQNTNIDFKVSNILQSERISVYKSYKAEDQLYSKLNPGISFSIGISHKF